MHDFRRLRVWQRSRELVIALEPVIRAFPVQHRATLGSQLRRAAMSIPANIAEGCGKSSRAETIRFLEIAAGSAAESESHLTIAGDLGAVTGMRATELAAEARSLHRMLRALIGTLPR